MFKTSEECQLQLVSYTMLADDTVPEAMMDFMPCSAARVSFGNEDKTGKDPAADVKLMNYLASHKHMTPFEYQHATFLIECPLFIRSQIHRHRTFSFNEISRRYTDENLDFWVPDKWRCQHKSSRQASSNEHTTYSGFYITGATEFTYEDMMHNMLLMYQEMVGNGIAREQARAVLPQSLLTKFYMGGNLRNWAHFIELRKDEHAQPEVQVVANRIADRLRELWPESCKALGI